ncbi:MAG: magnesium chelatase subunit I [Candidatus Sericytochromatia bacterium]|nr:MAG: magnesium chelatase subunit I [Candidatus Sericytochromatia bacterium]
MTIEELTYQIKEELTFINNIKNEISKIIIGQKKLIDSLLIGIFTNGHILVEGVPGLAKTTTVKVLSELMNLNSKRIQFTPDLLPADLIGTEVYVPKEGTFNTKKGPIFTNILIADEINRAPSKVQSALLEAMQEKQVTIGDKTFYLEEPFIVLATQNPIEQEGTYSLPEAQADRFMFKIKVSYPSKEEEKEILKKMSISRDIHLNKLIQKEDIFKIRTLIEKIYLDDKLQDYIIDLVFATREPYKYGIDLKDIIDFGVSPRATIYLARASKCKAFLNGRAYVIPSDIKDICYDIMRHRLILSYEAIAENIDSDYVINKILDSIEVP